MLHGSVTQVAIWCISLIGLTPALVLALAAILFAAFEPQTPPQPGAQVVLRHNHVLQIGPVRLDWHPRMWAGVALAAGVGLIVAALVFLLHVPSHT